MVEQAPQMEDCVLGLIQTGAVASGQSELDQHAIETHEPEIHP